MKTPRPTTTIRAVLDMLGGPDYVEMSDWIRDNDLDIPVEAGFCTWNTPGHQGEFFVLCGGDCIVSFTPRIPGSARWRPLYLVHDDMHLDAWHSRARVQNAKPYHEREDIGPCPRKRLRLVQSA